MVKDFLTVFSVDFQKEKYLCKLLTNKMSWKVKIHIQEPKFSSLTFCNMFTIAACLLSERFRISAILVTAVSTKEKS